METGRGHFRPDTSFFALLPLLHSCERSTTSEDSEFGFGFEEQQLWLVQGEITEEHVYDTDELREDKEGSKEVRLLVSLFK